MSRLARFWTAATALVLVIIGAASSVQATPESYTPLEFDAPSFFRGAGQLEGQGDWLLAIESHGVAERIRISARDVEATHTTSSRAGTEYPLGNGFYHRDPAEEPRSWDELDVLAEFGDDAMVVIKAQYCEGMGFDSGTMWGITEAGRRDPLYGHTPGYPQLLGAWAPPDKGLATSLQTSAVALTCTDAEAVFYGVTGRDSSNDFTLESGAVVSHDAGGMTGANVARHQHGIIRAEHIVIQTETPADILAYATDARLAVNGQASFPWATTDPSLEGFRSTINDTLVLQGNMSFEDWQSADNGRFTTQMDGSVDAVFINGALTTSSAPTVTVATAAGAAVLLGLAAKLVYGAALFTRLPAEEALKHPRRRALADYVKENPGATFRELVRAVDIPAGTCRHHLSVLARSQVLAEHRHKSTVRFFENHGKYDQTWETVVMLREPELAELHGFIEANEGLMQKQILDHAARTWDWSRSTTQHRLQRLVEGGVLHIREIGRRKCYHLKAAEPQPRPLWPGLST